MTEAEKKVQQVARQDNPSDRDVIEAIKELAAETVAIQEARFAVKH